MSKRVPVYLLITIIIFLSGVDSSSGQETQSSYLSAEEIESFEEQVEQLIGFLEYSFNAVGDPDVPVKEKEIIINHSYLKVFRDDKVQVEDDLDENRDVVTNKDVQAYLKDINFFYKGVKFQFDIEEVVHDINESGEIYFKVSLNRNLKGITISGDSINNNLPRYVEINLNDEEQELKVVSIYTTKLSEEEDLVNWWVQLTHGWREYFTKNIIRHDSMIIMNVQTYGDSVLVLKINDYSEADIHVDSPQDDADSIQWTRYDSVFIEVNDSIRFRLYDSIPPSTRPFFQMIRQLWSIREIDVSNNPDIISLEPLKKLSGLKVLDISNTRINDLTPIRNLSKLEKLDCSNTDVGNLDPLHYAINLKELNCHNTPVIHLMALKNFIHLTYLDCSNTGINDLEPLSGISALSELRCGNTLIDYLSPIEGLANLKKLDLSNTHITNLEPLKGLINLQYLNVDNTHISDLDPLTNLNNLQYIYLDYTAVENLDPLENLDQLKRIYCDQSNVDINIAYEFLKARPDVLVIYESGELESWWDSISESWKKILTNIVPVDSVPTREQLHEVIQIHEIDISGNDSIKDIDAVKKLINLHRLNISNTSISILDPIKQNIHLNYLDASGTGISEVGALEDLKSLTWLDISFTEVENIDPLNSLQELEYLNIDNTTVKNIEGLSALGSLGIIYADQSGVDQQSFDLFRNSNKECKIIFQTSHLQEWWNGLSTEWIEIFKTNADLSASPSKEQLQEITELEAIVFHNNSQVNTLQPLIIITGLKSLEFSGTAVTDLEPLGDLSKLEKISGTDSPVGSIGPLQKLTSLKILNISNTQPEDLDLLQNIHSLEKLNISGTPVKTLKFCESLTQLQELEFHNTRVNNLKPLLGLANLELIRCYNTGLTSKKVDKFKNSRQDVEIIFY